MTPENTSNERFLTLIRHAKSGWGSPALADIDRPLDERGLRDAPAMGLRLAARPFRPDLVLCSPAQRTRQTADFILQAMDIARSKIVFDNTIYEASPEDLLETVRRLPAAFREIFLIGHNPGLTVLANQLTGHPIDNLPTCAVFRLRLEAPDWVSLRPGRGEFVLFDSPKA
jgi:phosphohistidine phosphatase